MGKINEYQRKQLASSVTNVAPADKSGEIIGGAVDQFGSAMITEARRLDTYNTIQANSAVMEFGLAFQRLGAQEQRRMAANPGEYPDKIMEDGSALMETYAGAIEDPGVRKKFLESASVILKSGVFQAHGWAEAKKLDNVKISAKESIRLGTIMTGQATNVDELKQSIATVREMATTELPPEVIAGIDAEEFIKQNMPGVLDSYFINQSYSNPEQLIADIDAGKYNDVEYYTQEMEDKYKKAAQARIKQIDSEIKKAQKDNTADLTMDWIAGNLTMEKVNAMWMNRDSDPMNSISTADKNNFEKGLIDRMNTEAGKTMAAHPDSKQYINLIYNAFDDRVDQAKALESVIKVYSDGYTNKDELVFLTQLKANLRDVQTAKVSNGFFRGCQNVTHKVKRMWTDRGDTLSSQPAKEAYYLSQLVGYAREGVPPETATQNVVNAMERDKVVEDNPNLAGSKDPVMDAYRQQAEEQLKANGYKVDAKRVETLANELKARYGRK